jgi:hypothetical protein
MARTVKRCFLPLTTTLTVAFTLPVCAQRRHLRNAAVDKITAPTTGLAPVHEPRKRRRKIWQPVSRPDS